MNIYTIPFIPDPFESSLQLRYGDVKGAIFAGWQSLLRMVSETEPGSLQVSLCFLFTPQLTSGVQGRLKLWIKTNSSNPKIPEAIIENGPVSQFYPIVPAGDTPIHIPWSEFNAMAEIVRRIDLVASYVPREKNHRVPKKPYKSILQFDPNNSNDFMGLDKLLGSMQESAYIEISVQPVNALSDLQTIYHYAFNLANVNEGVFYEPSGDSNDEELDEHRKKYGFMRDHLAEEVLQEYEDVSKNLRKPQLRFYIRIVSSNLQNTNLIASNIAESAFNNGLYRILLTDASDEEFEQRLEDAKKSQINLDWQHSDLVSKNLRNIVRMGSVEDLSGIFRFPVASNVSPKTIRKKTDPTSLLKDKNGRMIPNILVGDDMESEESSDRNLHGGLEELFDVASESCIEHRLPLDLLKKHLFVCGVPGSGKTTAIFNFLIQLYRNKIPFLVIEPAKTEYRILKTLKGHKIKELSELGNNLKVFTPGNENVSPFRFNPFSYPEEISLDEHINNMMNCFKSAMPLPADSPLPALLSKAIEEVYEGFEDGEFPFMDDLVNKVKELMDSPELGYDSEIKGNLKTAIEVRLSPLVSKKRSIGKIFSNDMDAPQISEMLDVPVVIEMDSLDTDQANLLTLFIMTSLRENIKATRRSGSKLTHAVILEEAHNVVGNIPEGADPDDPRKRAADYISRMLAELRSLGEGIIIADQLPSTVADGVIKNTGTKLAHRLTSMDDREEIGYTMLLGENEIEEFARLRVGEAFYYSEGLYRPRRIRCINSNDFLGFSGKNSQPPDDKQLFELLKTEDWFEGVLIKELKEDIVNYGEYLKKTDNSLEKKYLEELLLLTNRFEKGEVDKKQLEDFLLKLRYRIELDNSRFEQDKAYIKHYRSEVKKFSLSDNYNKILEEYENYTTEIGHHITGIIDRIENYYYKLKSN